MKMTTILPALLGATLMNAAAGEWDDWRDGRRVLVVRAGSPEDVTLRQQMAVLSAGPDGLAVRDVVVLQWAGEEDPKMWPSGVKALAASVLAARYAALRKAEWSVVLIGRDGDVKKAWDKVVPVEEVFAQIDAMPMGRREKQEREQGGR